MTQQRKVILEELGKVKTHPTADQVYEMVRRRLPHISLATVYRNLEVLSEDGAIKKLELAGAQRRYDGDTSNHYHVRCTQCGRVADVPMTPMTLPDIPPENVQGFEIEGHRVEFYGVCPECRRRGYDGKKHAACA